MSEEVVDMFSEGQNMPSHQQGQGSFRIMVGGLSKTSQGGEYFVASMVHGSGSGFSALKGLVCSAASRWQ
jgi:hypothetical protein